jgi:hypothetical protein
VLVNLFSLALKLGAFLALSCTLDRTFGRGPATFAALALLAAPGALLLDGNPNMYAACAVLWPAACLLLAPREGAPRRERPLLAGMLIFGATQISWLALAFVPALLALTANDGTTAGFRGWWMEWRRNRTWRAISYGAAIGLIVFVAPLPFLALPRRRA